MSNEKFHGAFVFRNQGHGILTSTYFNNHQPKPFPETAINRNKVNSDPFVGQFETIWIEDDGHYKLILNIDKGLEGAPETYMLRWKSVDSDKLEWQGLGILENGILFGCYW